MDSWSLPELQSIPRDAVYATVGGKLVDLFELTEKPLGLRVHVRVLGGKGGFGSLLRSFRFHKSSNEDMCRDLSGRRLRDVKEEAKLKKWIANRAQREAEKEAKKNAKYEKLKAGPSKHIFEDPQFHKTGEEIMEKIEDAVAFGLKTAEARALEEERTGALKRKAEEDAKAAVIKKKLKSDDPWFRLLTGTNGNNAIQSKKGGNQNRIEGKCRLAVDVSDLSESDEEDGEDGGKEAAAEEDEDGGKDVSSNSWTFTKADPPQPSADNGDGDVTPSGTAESAETHRNKLLRMLAGKTPKRDAKPTARDAKPTPQKNPPVQLTSYEKKDPDLSRKADTAEEEKVAEKKSESPKAFDPIDLENATSAEEIEQNFPLDHLKAELIRRGLKCGGSGAERAKRLWLVRGLREDEIPKKLRAKAPSP